MMFNMYVLFCHHITLEMYVQEQEWWCLPCKLSAVGNTGQGLEASHRVEKRNHLVVKQDHVLSIKNSCRCFQEKGTVASNSSAPLGHYPLGSDACSVTVM